MSEQKKKKKKRSNKKRWSIKKKIIVSTVVVFALIIGMLASGYLYVRSRIYSGLNPSEITSDTEYHEVDGITNVLLLGTDARTLDEAARADSIIIATLDNNNKNIRLTSLFRDTLVNIPGHGEGKLNAALAYGGPELLIETIKNTYGISLDKYIIINFWGFEAIIDQMGGLEFDVEEYMLEELNKYIGESTGGNDCPVTEAGVQVLNGKQALSYARIRKGVGDEYARTDRQREVLVKVAEKLKETKPSKYLGIMNSMLDYIKTNIDPLEALNMAYTIYKFPALEIEQLQIPIPDLADGRLYKNLGWVFLMDTEQNAKYLREFVFENKIPDSSTYDYDSFKQAMADYKAEESDYNDRHNINPEDYEDNSADVTEPPASNNSNQGGTTGGSNGGTTKPPVSDEKEEEVTPPTTPPTEEQKPVTPPSDEKEEEETPPTTPPTEEQKPETPPSDDGGQQETNPTEVKPAE
ncbi:LCP family protein [Clostridium sp. 1001271B_151109_B4]|uniref:LCP family protein n=1 Tax=Clostridium sp. 1001271B_151109_B4 TaxID=2787148 RepID=UPI0018A8F9A6|nr:LCP family protein [Clostridium sp. 1001271B_151109_B4]